MGVFEGSRVATGKKGYNALEVSGTKGSFRFSMECLNELEVLTENNRGWERIFVTGDDDPFVDHWWPDGHVIGWEHAFVHENYEFLEAIADGRAYEPGFEDGLAVQRLVDAIKRGNERGKWVDL
jgi:predicted dehydrogenase